MALKEIEMLELGIIPFRLDKASLLNIDHFPKTIWMDKQKIG